MNDWQGILAVLVALYLVESILWLPEPGVTVRRPTRGKWEVHRGGWRLDAFNVKLQFPPLLFPAGRVLLCDEPQFGAGIGGFWTNPFGLSGPNPGAIRYFSFSSIQTIDSDGRKLRVDGNVVTHFSSTIAAAKAASFLNQLKASRTEDRRRVISEELSRICDVESVRRSLGSLDKSGRSLRLACQAQMLLLFLVFPLSGYYLGLRMTWLPLLAAVVINSACISVLFKRAHTQVYGPESPPPEGTAATFALSPVDAAHAALHLHKGAVSWSDPLAIAAVVCDRSEFEHEASRRLRHAMFPLPDCDDSMPGEFWIQEAEFRKLWIAALETLISEAATDPDHLVKAPAKEEAGCNSYCPRCRAQYVFNDGRCADCDLGLVRF